jgi:hypothetical protein
MVAAIVKRVRILRLPGRFVVGSMPAQIGMDTEAGPVVRVNAKSVVTKPLGCGEFRRTDTLNISMTEARKFGWKA